MNYKKYKLDAIPGKEFSKEYPLFSKQRKKKTSSFPETFSRRSISPPVMDQGRSGSCVGASGYVVYGNTKEFESENPSAKWIYQIAKKHDQYPGEAYQGTSIEGAGNGLKQVGCLSESEFPYENVERYDVTKELEEKAKDKKIKNLYYAFSRDVDTIKELLLKECAWVGVVARENIFYVDKTGVINDKEYLDSSTVGGHALAIIGWKTIEGKLYWECQNSWGNKWGDKGYCYISSDLMNKICFKTKIYFLDLFSEQIVVEKKKEIVTKERLSLLQKILTPFIKLFKRYFG